MSPAPEFVGTWAHVARNRAKPPRRYYGPNLDGKEHDENQSSPSHRTGAAVKGRDTGRGGALAWGATAAALVAAAAAALGIAAASQQTPPRFHATTLAPSSTRPEAPNAGATPSPSTAGTPGTPTGAAGAENAMIMPPSAPTHISIPAIGVNHDLRPTGLNPDGTLATPPLTQVQWPVWYKYSPTPGQRGPAVIVGHIDSATDGGGVFFKLGAMRAGDTIIIGRRDGSAAQFTVYKTAEYNKANFPTSSVYGNTADAEVRLISCGGAFDTSKKSYEDDIVIYARLTQASS